MTTFQGFEAHENKAWLGQIGGRSERQSLQSGKRFVLTYLACAIARADRRLDEFDARRFKTSIQSVAGRTAGFVRTRLHDAGQSGSHLVPNISGARVKRPVETVSF
jgi:hypothetical protein